MGHGEWMELAKAEKKRRQLEEENKQLRDTLLEISQLPQYGNQLDIDRLQEAITLATDALEGGM